MMTISRVTVGLTAALFLSLAGCSSEKSPSPFGSIVISAALSAADVATVGVTVTGPGIAAPMTASLTKSGSEWTGTVGGVPAGSDRTVKAEARSASGTLIYQGTATGVTVSHAGTAAVVIVMQQVTPPPPNNDNSPVIDGVVASDLTPLAGDTITLDVTAHDMDAGAVLSYQWTATGGTFTPSAANAAHVEWTVPSPNTTETYTITVTVADEEGLVATASFDLGVPLTAGSLELNVSVNTWPVVTAMTASPTSVAAGSPIALAATTSDSDGDTVTVTWSADCTGSFSHASGTSTSFTPSSVPVGNLCTVTATATDGRGGAGTGSRGVWVGLSAPPVTQDPGAGEPAELAGITAAHNAVRASVGVGPLTWDPALAATAAAWAATCTDVASPTGLLDHNPNRSAGTPVYVGENIYASTGNATALGAVNGWASEAAWYDYATNTCAPGGVCGHYTQIVWRNTQRLGCAKQDCPSLVYRSTIVCDYAPGGNIPGQRPY